MSEVILTIFFCIYRFQIELTDLFVISKIIYSCPSYLVWDVVPKIGHHVGHQVAIAHDFDERERQKEPTNYGQDSGSQINKRTHFIHWSVPGLESSGKIITLLDLDK